MPTYRTLTAITLALAALSAGCGGTVAEEPTSAATTARTSPAAEPAQPFEGTWQAGPAPLSQVVAALETAGMSQWADTVLLDNEPSSRLTSELKVQGGYVLMSWTVDERPLGVQDRQAYTASGSSLELKPIGSACRALLNWTVTGDQLSFELVDDTCPDYKGTPDAAMMVGLYASLPFQRVDA